MKDFTVLLPKGMIFTQQTMDTVLELQMDFILHGQSMSKVEGGKLIRILPEDWHKYEP